MMPTMTERTTPSRLPQRLTLLCALVPTGLFVVAAAVLILMPFERGRGAADQINYHEVVIRDFAEQWPAFDFSDYLSATTPAYHVVLATFGRFVADSRASLQFAGAVFTIGLLLTLTLAGVRRGGAAQSVLFTLPVVASLYVFSSGVWLLPDNAAWWGVLGIMLLALRADFGTVHLLGSGVILMLLVATRQIHLWAAAVVWAAAWIGPTQGNTLAVWTDLLHNLPVRIRRTFVAVTVTLPAFGVVFWFVRLWDGLSPPILQTDVQGFNAATPAFILAQIGLFSLFFAGWLIEPARTLVTKHRTALVLAIGAGLVIALVPATTYSVEAGRFSGLWNIANKTPVIAGRVSPLIVVMAVGGMVACATWFVALPMRTQWIALAALVAFVAAQSTSHNAWQRYHEPFILILMAVLAPYLSPPGFRSVEGAAPNEDPHPSPLPGGEGARLCHIACVAGPLMLAILLGLVTVVTLMNARPVKPLDNSASITALKQTPNVAQESARENAP
jgi:hypothetical protein